MPQLASFSEDQPKLANRVDDGLIRVGKVTSHNSLRFLSLGLFFLLVQVGVTIVKLESKAGLLLVCAGLVAAAFIVTWGQLRIIVHLESGTVITISLDRARLRELRKLGSSDPMAYRPRYTEGGVTLIELRSDWRGDSRWEVYVPATVTAVELEDHLRTYLPRLESAIIDAP